MLTEALLILSLGVLVALSNWRLGIYAVVAMAFLQDPLRKLMVGEPSFFILFAAVIFFAALLRGIGSGVPTTPNRIPIWSQYMRTHFNVFLAILFLQAAHSLVRFGNPLIPALGLVEYLAPFAALVVGYGFAKTGGVPRIRRFLWVYLAFALPALCTIALQASGTDWPALGEVGVGIRISGMGGRLIAYSGTFRSSEIAAWHAGTASCIVIILATQYKVFSVRTLIAVSLIALIVALGILTGRRKFIAMIAIFVCLYITFVTAFIWRKRGIGLIFAALGLIAYAVGPSFVSLESELDAAAVFEKLPEFERRSDMARGDYDLYLNRAGSVFGDAEDRFLRLGLAPIVWAYNWFGVFGAGLGAGAQGARFVGGHTGPAYAAAEGGLGKLMLDLGAPGLVIAILMVFSLIRMAIAILRQMKRQSLAVGYFGCGLFALIAANAANFAVASQAYGDLFILLFLGLIAGAALAIPSFPLRGGFRSGHLSLHRGKVNVTG